MNSKEKKELNYSLSFLVRSSFIILIGVIASKIISYFYRILIARNFGPETYGFFSIGLMISSIFVTLAAVGLIEGNFRYIALYRGKKEINKIQHIYKISLYFLSITGIISMILMFLLSETIAINLFHNKDLIIFLQLFSLAIPLTILMGFFGSIILAYERAKPYTIIFHFLLNVVKLISLVFFIYLGLNYKGLIFSYILGVFMAVIAFYLVIKYSIKEIFGKNDLDKNSKFMVSRDLFNYSWPFLFSAIIVSIFHWTDSFIIGYFQTAQDVGIYNAAVPIALLLTIAPELFMGMFFPLVTKEYSQKNTKVIKELSKRVGKWVFILNLPLLAILLIFPKEIITILFGLQYILAINPLRILSLGVFFSSIFLISNKLIETVGKSKLILFDTLIVALINLGLNIILVPKYGLDGAAISTTISFIILNTVFLFQARYYISIVPLKYKMVKIFFILSIPSIFVLLVTFFIKMNTLSAITLSVFLGLSYILLLFTTKALDKEDFILFKEIKNKFKNKNN